MVKYTHVSRLRRRRLSGGRSSGDLGVHSRVDCEFSAFRFAVPVMLKITGQGSWGHGRRLTDTVSELPEAPCLRPNMQTRRLQQRAAPTGVRLRISIRRDRRPRRKLVGVCSRPVGPKLLLAIAQVDT